MRSVGIDIGSTSLKIVEVQSTNKGVQVLSYTEHPLGTNPSHDPELEILEILQSVAEKVEQTQSKVVLALRQDRVSVRFKTFPFNDRLKILKSLPFELEEDLPFSSETAIYDAKIIRHIGDGAEVLACATPKTRVQEFLQRFSSTGLVIQQLTSEAIAFGNCLEAFDQPLQQDPAVTISLDESPSLPRSLKMLVHIGHSHSLVTVYEGNRVVGVRSLLWGVKTLADSVSRKYELPFAEALNEVKSKAFVLPNKDGASYDQIVFSDTISHPFREFGRELKLTQLEFETELGGVIMGAEITGGGAGVINICSLLTQALEVPVNTASFLSRFHTHFEITPQIENSIGVALGLALEGLRKPRNPGVQFLRAEFAPHNEGLQIFWQTWKKSIQVGAGLVAVFFLFASLRETFSSQLASHGTEVLSQQAKALAKLGPKQANASGVKKYIREKRKRAQDMKALAGLAKMNSAMDVLKKISEATPPRSNINLVVSSFQVEDSHAVLTGTVGNLQEKATMEKIIRVLAKDGKVSSRNVTSPPGALGVAFGFEFQVDRGVEK